MSSLLQVYQAKPNPVGKDKTSGGIPKPEQLIAEWVDIKNVGTEPVRFSTIELHHTLFGDRCEATGRTERYWSGNGSESLKPGQVLRIYTGSKRYEHLLTTVDKGNVDWRGFAERDNFVLNNVCGDTIIVTWADANGNPYRDAASYGRNVPEGVILRRSGSYLLPVSSAATP